MCVLCTGVFIIYHALNVCIWLFARVCLRTDYNFLVPDKWWPMLMRRPKDAAFLCVHTCSRLHMAAHEKISVLAGSVFLRLIYWRESVCTQIRAQHSHA